MCRRLSSRVAFGRQIAEPIVLHRDAVSGGGYFMLGTVISADMDLIGQLQPHMPARFVDDGRGAEALVCQQGQRFARRALACAAGRGRGRGGLLSFATGSGGRESGSRPPVMEDHRK
jgi:hypothetical protein